MTSPPIRCERLLWTWNQATLADTGPGYGPVARSAGWPFRDRADSTGGLGNRTRYLPAEASSLLADHDAPVALSLRSAPEGKLLLYKQFLGEDAFGRNSRWLVHALLDQSDQLHPADALAALQDGLLPVEMGSELIPTQTDLAVAELVMAPPPVTDLDRHEQLLTRLIPGIALIRDRPQFGPVVIWAAHSSAVIDLLNSLIAVLPRAFSASLSFSTFEAKPAAADTEIAGAIDVFSADPRKEPDQLWIDLVESATNLPPPDQDESEVTTELLDAARSGQRPPDGLASFADLRAWTRGRVSLRAVIRATSSLQQGISLDPPADAELIDAVIGQGEDLPEADRLLWLSEPGVAERVAQRSGQGWTPMASTLARATLRGAAWPQPFAVLLKDHPGQIAPMIAELLERQEIEDAALLDLAGRLPVDALPGLFDVLVDQPRVHAGFLLFDVLADPRLEPDSVRRRVLEPLLSRHWGMLGLAANLPPAVVASLSVPGPAADSGHRDRPEDRRAAKQDAARPAPEGLRRWLPGLR